MKNIRLNELKAWCNGRAYDFPHTMVISKVKRGYELRINTNCISLCSFFFTKKDINSAYRIAIKNLK